MSPMASGEQHRGIDMPKPLDTEGLFSLSKTSKDEATDSSKKAVSEILPRIYLSHRRISCTRCFPEGCGRKTSSSGNDVGAEANASKAIGLEHEICMEGMSFEEAIESDTHKSKTVMKIIPGAYPLRRKASAARCFPENCGRKVSQESQKVGEEIIACKTNDSISQCGIMNHQEGQVPIDLVLPVSRKIVLGLMASLKCPWRRGKGAQKLNSNGGVGKGKKH